MNAYILRIKGAHHWLYNEKSKEMEKFYEVEVLGGEKRGTESVREGLEAEAPKLQPRLDAKV